MMYLAGARHGGSARSIRSSRSMSPPTSLGTWRRMSAPSVKQHLACIRMLFDWLVTGQVVPVNPADSVPGAAPLVSKGPPVLSSEEATALLGGMDVSTVVGAIIAVMTHTFARVGAVVALNAGITFRRQNAGAAPPRENGKLNEMPCHHKLESFLDATGVAP